MVSKQIWKCRNTVVVSSSIHTVQNLSKLSTEFQLGQHTPKQEKLYIQNVNDKYRFKTVLLFSSFNFFTSIIAVALSTALRFIYFDFRVHHSFKKIHPHKPFKILQMTLQCLIQFRLKSNGQKQNIEKKTTCRETNMNIFTIIIPKLLPFPYQ